VDQHYQNAFTGKEGLVTRQGRRRILTENTLPSIDRDDRKYETGDGRKQANTLSYLSGRYWREAHGDLRLARLEIARRGSLFVATVGDRPAVLGVAFQPAIQE
jgi:hypothetical protein